MKYYLVILPCISVFLLSCGQAQGTSESISSSSTQESISTSLSQEELSQSSYESIDPSQMEGNVGIYEKTVSKLVALEEMVGWFHQWEKAPHWFYALDDSKIEDLYDISYTVHGFYHFLLEQYVDLQKIDTSLKTKKEDTEVSITIFSKGTHTLGDSTLIKGKKGKYSLIIGEETVAEINTTANEEFVSELLNKAGVYLPTFGAEDID